MKIPKDAFTTRKISVLSVFIHTLTGHATRKAFFTYLGTVFRDFFWLQFSVKFGLKKIPILSVDHQCDEYVPFTPEKVSIYLDFARSAISERGLASTRRGNTLQSFSQSSIGAIATPRRYTDSG
jgi:hypothetical protein